MKVHVFGKEKGTDFIEHLSTALEKAEFIESLPGFLAENSIDFDSAIVMYENGNTTQATTLKDLLAELGKYGL